ncbi:MAG: DNA cytosine methyltransferase [Bacteroidales bacterium]|nr:DNA cytosine methyltransferase [Bacteroidales bacterium]
MEYWLSLFDGMSCLQIAAKELGISPDKYYASEIDQHAIKQTQLNFPDTIQLGSVTEWKTWDIDWSKVSLIGAGSPCQGFSFAGKQLAFDDPRSVLFFVFIDILNHARKFNPNVKFLLENVDMKREHMNVINNYCGLFAVNINSNRVSAQNRNRWYWSNIRTKKVGLFGETHTDIPQPKDRGILLKDILEKEVPEKYYLSDKVFSRISGSDFFNDTRDIEGKSKCITVKEWAQRNDANYIKVDKQLKPKPDQLKASCFTAGGNSGGNHSDMDLICVAMRGREEAVLTPKRTEYGKQISKKYEAREITEQRKNIQQLEPRTDGKTNTLTSVQNDNLVMCLNESNSQSQRVQLNADKSVCISGEGGGGGAKTGLYKFENRIRRLTPTECARLQTVPEWYKWGCSDTQQYRMLGNGWTVQVIAHILSFLK